MANTDKIQAALMRLPLPARAMILDELAKSVHAEFDQIADQSLREDIQFVEKRLAEFDASEIDTLPFAELQRRVFGPR